MTSTLQFRILVVDDDDRVIKRLKQRLPADFDTSVEFQFCDNFDEAEELLLAERYDLTVLDVRLDGTPGDEDRGRRAYERVAAIRWLPVVFFTAKPGEVEELKAEPLVAVVNKRNHKGLVAAIKAGLNSGVPEFTRRLSTEIDQVLRDFLRDHVARHWVKMSDEDHRDILVVLANRLSAFIKHEYVERLHTPEDASPAVAHPSAARFYLLPPITDGLTTGDMLRHKGQWVVVLTPACDFVESGDRERKVDFVRIAPAIDPVESVPGLALKERANSKNKGNFKNALRGRLNRYFHLPAFRDVPNLLVDFDQVTSLPYDEINQKDGWERVATIDSPFCEAMLQHFGHGAARIGVEDLPIDHLVDTAFDEAMQASAADNSP